MFKAPWERFPRLSVPSTWGLDYPPRHLYVYKLAPGFVLASLPIMDTNVSLFCFSKGLKGTLHLKSRLLALLVSLHSSGSLGKWIFAISCLAHGANGRSVLCARSTELSCLWNRQQTPLLLRTPQHTLVPIGWSLYILLFGFGMLGKAHLSATLYMVLSALVNRVSVCKKGVTNIPKPSTWLSTTHRDIMWSYRRALRHRREMCPPRELT
jgi:hypothetical protein